MVRLGGQAAFFRGREFLGVTVEMRLLRTGHGAWEEA
jgi:hypothetical protein